MLNKPTDRYFTILGGSVMTSGYSLNLGKGTIGLFDLSKQTKDGLAAISNLKNFPKNKEVILKMGADNSTLSRTHDVKGKVSAPFKLSEVIDVKVSAPDISAQLVDEVVIGYDGINANSAIDFTKGEVKKFTLKLSGEAIGKLGYPKAEVIIEHAVEADDCDPYDDCVDCNPCSAVDPLPLMEQVADFFRNFELRGGVKASEFIDVTVTKSCGTVPTYNETSYSFFNLSICDTGDANALALVQAQYPTYKIIRKDRKGSTSVYELLAPTGTSITAHAQSIASILKGCEDCPSGYTAVAGGVLYTVTIEDDGTDKTSTVQGITGAVANTAVLNGRTDGVGFYSVVMGGVIPAATQASFITSNPTAVFYEVGETEAICKNSTVTNTSWVSGEACKVAEGAYTITVADDGCGNDRLAELQAAYPEYTINYDGTSKIEVTLTGTSGTATVTTGGDDYTATFATDLTTTAANFVTAHAAAILAATGAVVTSNAAKVIFTFNNLKPITVEIDNASGDLDGTVAAVAVVTKTAGGCSHKYIMLGVPTNLVCEECSSIYKDGYRVTDVENFENEVWEAIAATPAYATCKTGLKFTGKVFEIHPDDVTRDYLATIEDSVQIEVAGGYLDDIREGIGYLKQTPMKVTRLSTATPRTHLGGRMWNKEDESNFFFNGVERHDGDLIARILGGEQSHLESNKQYVDVAITINRSQYAGFIANGYNTTHTYHLLAEFGRHDAVLTLANNIAAAAGLPAVAV